MKDVHKVPALDLVGWYTIMPTSGPQPDHLPLHQMILESYNESAIILGFHPAAVLDGSVGGKLPLTIYESNFEAEDVTTESGEDKEMTGAEAGPVLKFKELPYTVETGEAEMISVDFVARGGGNATAVESGPKDDEPTGKGKGKESKGGDVAVQDKPRADDRILSREDDELIASLTAKANAIKMLHSRINLIASYLQNLPPTYVSSAPEGIEDDSKKYMPVNHAVLRSIQALLSRLSLLIYADTIAFEKELISEQNDVGLVSLLSSITESVTDMREMGRKFAVVESGKTNRNKYGRNDSHWADGAGGVGIPGVGDLLS